MTKQGPNRWRGNEKKRSLYWFSTSTIFNVNIFGRLTDRPSHSAAMTFRKRWYVIQLSYGIRYLWWPFWRSNKNESQVPADGKHRRNSHCTSPNSNRINSDSHIHLTTEQKIGPTKWSEKGNSENIYNLQRIQNWPWWSDIDNKYHHHPPPPSSSQRLV